MKEFIYLVIGLVVGGTLGFFCAALLAAGNNDPEWMKNRDESEDLKRYEEEQRAIKSEKEAKKQAKIADKEVKKQAKSQK